MLLFRERRGLAGYLHNKSGLGLVKKMCGAAERGCQSAGVSRRHTHRGGECCVKMGFALVAVLTRSRSKPSSSPRQQLPGQGLAAVQKTGLSPALFPAAGRRFQPVPGEDAKHFGAAWSIISGKHFPVQGKQFIGDPNKMTPSQTHLVIVPAITRRQTGRTVRQALALGSRVGRGWMGARTAARRPWRKEAGRKMLCGFFPGTQLGQGAAVCTRCWRRAGRASPMRWCWTRTASTRRLIFPASCRLQEKIPAP